MAIQISSGQIKAANIITSLIADDAVNSAKIAAGAVDSTALAADSVVSAKIANGAIDSNAYLADSVVTAAKIDLSGTFDFSSGTLRAATPSSSTDVTNKGYVDGLVGAGVFWKEPAAVATVTNINLSNPGTDTFDGFQITSGARVLVQSQSTQSQNGLYTFNGSGSALSRTSDADNAAELNGMAVFVKSGNTLADQALCRLTKSQISDRTMLPMSSSQDWVKSPLEMVSRKRQIRFHWILKQTQDSRSQAESLILISEMALRSPDPQ